MNPTGQITEHFSWEEALCRDGCEMPKAIRAEVRATAQWAEDVRTALGGRPMRVVSWYRCPKYNAKVGGKPRSQHLKGKAIDFAHKDLTPRQTQNLVKIIYLDLVRGFGRYPGFTHVDRRSGAPETW